MKKIFLIICISIIPLFIFASDNKNKAEKLLSSFYKIKTLSADFTQRNIIPTSSGIKFNAPELSTSNKFIEDLFSGKLYIQIGKIALWDYITPYKSWYILDNSSITQYDEINNQLIKYNGDEARENILLQIVILPSTISNNFNFGHTKQLNSDFVEIELFPKRDFGLDKILITLRKDGIIQKIESKDKANSKTIITFTNMQIDKELPKNIFKKEIPKNATRFER